MVFVRARFLVHLPGLIRGVGCCVVPFFFKKMEFDPLKLCCIMFSSVGMRHCTFIDWIQRDGIENMSIAILNINICLSSWYKNLKF